MSNGGQVPGPPGGYPAGGYASTQAVSQGPEGRLRAWARRRPEPRLWVTLAGAGCILAVTGLQLIAGDAQAPEDGGDGSNIPGIILSLLVVVDLQEAKPVLRGLIDLVDPASVVPRLGTALAPEPLDAATLNEAARLATYAGGLVVMERGTATVSAEELAGAIRGDAG